MLISTTHEGIYHKVKDDKKAIKIIKDAGFTAYDFSLCEQPNLLWQDNYLDYAKELREYADSIGIICNQTHATYPTGLNESNTFEELARHSKNLGVECDSFEKYNEKTREKILREIAFSGVLGAKVCVIHPKARASMEENTNFYLSLEAAARKYNVKIGVENIYDWIKGTGIVDAPCSNHHSFKQQLDKLPADVFVGCIDIGHAEIAVLNTSASQMVETLGDRMGAMHLHDVDLVRDNHFLPFSLKVDYLPIVESLKKIGYQGDITLEANVWKNLPDELLPEFARWLAIIAAWFQEKVQ